MAVAATVRRIFLSTALVAAVVCAAGCSAPGSTPEDGGDAATAYDVAIPTARDAGAAVARDGGRADAAGADGAAGLLPGCDNPPCARAGEALAGVWYLADGDARLEATFVTDAAGALVSGTLREEDSTAVPAPLTGLQWDPLLGVLRFRRRNDVLDEWYDARVVAGVLTGRVAVLIAGATPTAADYTEQVTGWSAAQFDRDLAPRTYAILWDGRQRARLRIDRAADDPSRFVGTFKVTSTLTAGARGEGLEYDVEVREWDGRALTFVLHAEGEDRVCTAEVAGRFIVGRAASLGTSTQLTFSGQRAEVLGHGLTTRTRHERAQWAGRTRRALEHLIMADNPAPLATTTYAVQQDLPPIEAPVVTVVRDDHLAAWPQAYRLAELNASYRVPDPAGGAEITRESHLYVAVPTTPAPAGGFPVALVLNGHGGSAYSDVDPNGWYWYGDAFARRGYVVVAVDISHRPPVDSQPLYYDAPWGDDAAHGNWAHPAIAAAGQSSSWEEDGERAWDAMRALDYALTLPGVNTRRVVVAGHSLGGEVATLVGALDPRVTTTVIAGFSPDLAVIRYSANHACWRWQRGDVSEYLDVSDYHALIAPRGLVVEAGLLEDAFSSLATPYASAKQIVRRDRAVYADMPARLLFYLHPGGHEFRVGDLGDPISNGDGVALSAVDGPAQTGSVAWQMDPTTVPTRLSLFELLDRLLAASQ